MFDFVRDGWRDYVSLLDVRDENDALRSRLASVEEENLQLREALVASTEILARTDVGLDGVVRLHSVRSGRLLTLLTTVGVPHAIASMATMPKGS